MIRRILVMAVACVFFSGACMALAGKSREGYPMMPAADPMSKDDVETCLRASGMHVERFAGEVPFRHALRVEVEEYRGGRLTRKRLDGVSLSGGPGLHRLLALSKEDDGGLRLSFAYPGPGSTGEFHEARQVVPVKDPQGVRWVRGRSSRLIVGQRTELCRLYSGGAKAGAKDEARVSVAEAAARYDVVAAVFVTLQRQ